MFFNMVVNTAASEAEVDQELKAALLVERGAGIGISIPRAMARSDRYSIGTDDRTIREYVVNESRELRRRRWLRNVYYVVVSAAFAINRFKRRIETPAPGFQVHILRQGERYEELHPDRPGSRYARCRRIDDHARCGAIGGRAARSHGQPLPARVPGRLGEQVS